MVESEEGRRGGEEERAQGNEKEGEREREERVRKVRT